MDDTQSLRCQISSRIEGIVSGTGVLVQFVVAIIVVVVVVVVLLDSTTVWTTRSW